MVRETTNEDRSKTWLGARPGFWLGVGAFWGVLALLWLAAYIMIIAHPRYHLMHGVTIGMTKSEVIKRLGNPRGSYHSQDEINLHFGGGNYNPVPKYRIEKEVITYSDSMWLLYVYIGKDNKVTCIFLART